LSFGSSFFCFVVAHHCRSAGAVLPLL
jgi:hypothetical protein